jgi:O-antigen/teichoic acid export membrane protein
MINDVLKTIKNGAWLTADKILRSLFTFIVNVIIARYLGPDAFGQIAYAITILAVLQAISSLGMDGIIVKKFVDSQKKENLKNNAGLIKKLIKIKIITGSISLIFLAIYISLFQEIFEKTQVTYVLIIICISILFQSIDIVDLWFHSRSNSKIIIKAKIISYFISNSIKISFVIFGADLIWFATAILIEYSLNSLFVWLVYKKNESELNECSEENSNLNEEVKNILVKSWPLWLSTIFIVTYAKADLVIITKFLGSESSGIYAAVINICSIPLIASSVAYICVLPIMSKYSNNLKAFNFLFEKSIGILFFLSMIISCLISIYAEVIVNIIYGNKYQESVEVLKIYAWSLVPAFLGNIQGAWLIALNKTKYAYIQTLIPAILSVSLNIYLIPIYGLKSAAFVNVLTQIAFVIIMPFFLYRDLSVRTIVGIFYIFNWKIKND